jgi:hypothetical protein
MATPQKEYLAAPSSSCCLTGHLHTGTPRGSFSQLANITTYISHPPAGKSNGHILLYFADVYGMFTNGQLVMDSFADAGYLTLGLDVSRLESHALPYPVPFLPRCPMFRKAVLSRQ